MAHLIDKDTLVAEIERRKQVAFGWMETAPNDAIEAQIELCDDFLSFLNTLEVKEVDLEKEYDDFQDLTLARLVNRNAGIVIAKHFFELGMQVSNPLIRKY